MVEITTNNKQNKVPKRIRVYAVLNILISLAINASLASGTGIFIFFMIGVVHCILWYCVVKYTLNNYRNHNHLFSLERKSIVGIIASIAHIVIYLNIYGTATASEAQSQLAWMYTGYIDMSLSPWFLASLPLTRSLTVSSIFVYGIFGTLFWYIVGAAAESKYVDFKKY